ncbi:MAG TPA: hypothetical protein VJA27_02095 [Patescibacteria group bacterium]|nr:hypothetical protein [Patescibacteria group bacterium]
MDRDKLREQVALDLAAEKADPFFGKRDDPAEEAEIKKRVEEELNLQDAPLLNDDEVEVLVEGDDEDEIAA